MKNLDEMKLLARMARNLGQPDLDLENRIKLEEDLNSRLFAKPKEEPIQILKEELPPAPAPAFEPPKKDDIIQQTVNAISSPKFAKQELPDFQQKELDGIRKQIAEIIQRMGTLSWGGGGTGVVKIGDTDDFDKSSYGEGKTMRWIDGMFRLADSEGAEILAATGEPLGHTDKTQSVISFDNTNRIFSISPVSNSFEIWTRGIRRTITNTRTITIPNITGLYYIYFDVNGELQYKTTFFDWPNDCITAYVYWNSSEGNAPFVADERHGITLDWQTHEYLHRTRGAAIASGFNADNYILNGDGSSNTHIQLDIASGTFFDEDLQVDITSTNTPVANTWQQDLIGPAKIPMFYLSGNAWKIDAPTDFPVKKGATLAQYNLYNGSSWSTADIDNNKFGVTFIVATNNINYPVIGVIGQSNHANQGDAEATQFQDLNLTGFPVVEMRPLFKLVYDVKTSYSNYVKARLVSIWDLRSFQSVASVSAVASDHGLLTGLSDNDHPQYLLSANAYSGVYTATTPSNWNGSAPTTIGAAIDRLAALIKTLNGGTGA